jgi:F0F1-type ATP synthase membrane subunit b/b'
MPDPSTEDTARHATQAPPERPSADEVLGAEPAAEPRHTARARGVRALKVYGALYLLLLIVYGAHVFTAGREVLPEAIEGGERVWSEVSFEAQPYGAITYEKGSRISPEMADLLVERLARETMEVEPDESRPGLVLAEPYRLRAGEERLALEGGTALTAEQVQSLQALAARAAEAAQSEPPKLSVRKTVWLYRDGWLHAVPWAGLLGVYNFLGLALALYTAAGDVVPQILAEHARKMEEELQTAREAQARAAELQRRAEEQARELSAERERILQKAEEEAAQEHERLLRRAREDAERLRESFQRHLETETQSAIDRLRARLGREAVAKAREEMGESYPESAHQGRLAEFILEMKGTRLP